MSKKDSKVSEAQLPTPPRVEQFIRVLQECKDKKEDTKEPINSNMFEDDSDHEDQIGKPKNTKRTELLVLNVAMEFQEVSAKPSANQR